MQKLALICVVFFSVRHDAFAQALDIGGIELRLEQPIDTALTRLRVKFNATYSDRSKQWTFFRKGNASDSGDVAGILGVEGKLVTSISKSYELADILDLASVYEKALGEGRRRGGTDCGMQTDTPSAGQIKWVATRCGQYMVLLMLPSRDPDSWGGVVLATRREK